MSAREPQRGDDELLNIATPSVINLFLDTVNAKDAVFGAVSELPRNTREETAQGRLTQSEIDAVVRSYLPPLAFRAAGESLESERLVVLSGDTGIGKRAGAISLLDELEVRDLIALSPAASLTELAYRKFDSRHGYLIIDRESTLHDTSLLWRKVRDTVRDANAYLVVTTPSLSAPMDDATVAAFEWERPDTRQLVRMHARSVDEASVDRFVDAVSRGATVAEVVKAARRFAEGVSATEALSEFDRVTAARVQDWLHGANVSQLIEVLVLAFFNGATLRTFEASAEKLAPFVASQLAGDSNGGGARVVLQSRRERAAPDSLIISGVDATPSRRERLKFRQPEYRKMVLAEFNSRYGKPFWDGVSRWIDTVLDSGNRAAIADGLALLAELNLEEVEHSYLDRWAADTERAPLFQQTASNVLTLMSYNQRLAGSALHTIIRWVESGDSAQRWTAALALSGPLGVLYLPEAARRLWDLIERKGGVNDFACQAFAMLFARLVYEQANEKFLLRTLSSKLTQFNRGGADARMRDLTLEAVLGVLSVPALGDTRDTPAIARLLIRRPDRVHSTARIWQDVQRNSRSKRRASEALLTTLTALERHGAREVSIALIEAFGSGSEDDRIRLERELTTTAARSARGVGNE